ncbi:FAD-dependent monooxygenase [Nostocoides australiense]|nr:FAD-dependent monooxygenase [Tetrasphaera australiensis]
MLDTPPGLSEFPHVIVNQARMRQFLLDYMARQASRLVPEYAVEFLSLTVDESHGARAVEATLRRGDGEEVTVRASYVVGCDGARSAVWPSAARWSVTPPRLGCDGRPRQHRLPRLAHQERRPVGR